MTMRFVESEGALLRQDADVSVVPEVWWPEPGEWHILPDLQAWYEGRPISSDDAEEQFPGVELEAATVYDPDAAEPVPSEPDE